MLRILTMMMMMMMMMRFTMIDYDIKPDIWKTAARPSGRTLASPQGRDRLRLRGPGSSPTGSCTQGRDTW